MDNYILISLLIGGPVVLGSIFFFYYIRRKYQEYDEIESYKEVLVYQRRKIRDAMRYFQKHYDTDFDNTLYRNVKTKTDFIMKLINNKPLKDQSDYLDRLWKMLYETEYRNKTIPDNVKAIITPLSTLMNELVTDQIDFIKNNIDENEA